jgi:hypothetical protein
VNNSGSARKLTFRHLAVFNHTQRGATAAASNGRLYQSATPFSGESMNANSVKLNSSTTLPSTVVVRRNASIPSFAAPGLHYSLMRSLGTIGTQETIFCRRINGVDKFSATYRQGSKRGTTAIEAITIPQNTGVALVLDTQTTESVPVRVCLVVSVNAKTIVWDFVSLPLPGLALFSLENTGTDTVKLLKFATSELGTTDTPYIRVVPIGQLYASDLADTSKQGFSIQKMDSAYPDLTALTVSGDIGFIPSGSPEVVVNEGSAGIPKGVNYLHTRDFNGPAYRVLFPEMRNASGAGSATDMLGQQHSHRHNDLLVRMRGSAREGITLNPGEGLALVASSETFIGVQPSYSGWPMLTFQALIDSEPLISPTLTLTGLKNPTEIRVFAAGTQTELTGQESVTSGVFSWNYDPDAVSSVDISVLALGYQNTRILGVATTGNLSIPVQQQVDRQYLNA